VTRPRPHLEAAPHERRLGARLRGVAGFIPGALTVGNMLAGYAAILMAVQDQFYAACGLILVAGVLDGLDGRVARLTRTTSDFGEHLDSLADTVSFAVAPSMLLFHMGIDQLGRAGWAVCFLFAACGVIRLARFNASPPRDPRYFIGFPIPAAAAAIICPVLFLRDDPLPPSFLPVQAGVMVVVALLMISPIRYRTFKDLVFGRRAYRALAVWAAILAGLIAAHEWVIPLLIGLYLVLPVIEWLGRGDRDRASIFAEDEEDEEVSFQDWPEDDEPL
jgi:CDP-diacylglycerol--serine O-phosphatidyltransferase